MKFSQKIILLLLLGLIGYSNVYYFNQPELTLAETNSQITTKDPLGTEQTNIPAVQNQEPQIYRDLIPKDEPCYVIVVGNVSKLYPQKLLSETPLRDQVNGEDFLISLSEKKPLFYNLTRKLAYPYARNTKGEWQEKFTNFLEFTQEDLNSQTSN